MARRITYVDEDGLSKHERAHMKAIKPLVQAAMDQAALEQTLAAGQKLVDAEQQRDAELLASARNAFPELRRGTRASSPPRAIVAAQAAGEGDLRRSSLPAAAHNAGWYSRRNGSPVVKDAGRSRAPGLQNLFDLPTGLAPQREGLEAEAAPFPDGLNIGG
jgi:hypothetical protein